MQESAATLVICSTRKINFLKNIYVHCQFSFDQITEFIGWVE